MSDLPPPTYRLLIRDTAPEGSPPVEVRLRHVLKGLLRGWGFRCREIEQVNDPKGALDAQAVLSHPVQSKGHSAAS